MLIESDNQEKAPIETVDDIESVSSNSIIQLKIVYWGPGESGKTTNFRTLQKEYRLTKLTNGYSIETTDGRTLWQDSMFLTFDIDLGEDVYTIITQIVTCTGQERFLATREYIIDGADGIVFVADSDPEKTEQNKRSFRELVSFAGPKKTPYIIQLNKRDLDNALSIQEFKKNLNLPQAEKYPDGSPIVYPATATEGTNVCLCFSNLIFQVLFNYFTHQ